MDKRIVLDSKSESVIFLCRKDKRLAKLIKLIGSVTYTPRDDPYKFLVHEIVEQILSVKAGAKIFERSVVFLTGIKLLSEDARVKEATNIEHYEAKGENVDV